MVASSIVAVAQEAISCASLQPGEKTSRSGIGTEQWGRSGSQQHDNVRVGIRLEPGVDLLPYGVYALDGNPWRPWHPS